eukprot:15452335-Alexandrium_andersonii.AAC.1
MSAVPENSPAIHAAPQAVAPASAIRPGDIARGAGRGAGALDVIINSRAVEASASSGMPQIQDQSAALYSGYTGTKWSCPSP